MTSPVSKLTHLLEQIGEIVDNNELDLPRDEWTQLNSALLSAYSVRHKAAMRAARNK